MNKIQNLKDAYLDALIDNVAPDGFELVDFEQHREGLWGKPDICFFRVFSPIGETLEILGKDLIIPLLSDICALDDSPNGCKDDIIDSLRTQSDPLRTRKGTITKINAQNPFICDYNSLILNTVMPVFTCKRILVDSNETKSVEEQWKFIHRYPTASSSRISDDDFSFSSKDLKGDCLKLVDFYGKDKAYLYREVISLMIKAIKALNKTPNMPEVMELTFVCGGQEETLKSTVGFMSLPEYTCKAKNFWGGFNRYYTLGLRDIYPTGITYSEEYSRVVFACDPWVEMDSFRSNKIFTLGRVDTDSSINLCSKIKPVRSAGKAISTILDLLSTGTDFFLSIDGNTACVLKIPETALTRYTKPIGPYESWLDILSIEKAYRGYASKYLSYDSFMKVLSEGVSSFDDYYMEIKENLSNDLSAHNTRRLFGKELSESDAQLIFLECFDTIEFQGNDKLIFDGIIEYTYYGLWKYNNEDKKFYVYLT